jgi:hypothetical protein
MASMVRERGRMRELLTGKMEEEVVDVSEVVEIVVREEVVELVSDLRRSRGQSVTKRKRR